ncbi:MAG: hypothetical protein Q9217_005421 [Psora testacea]
MVESSGLEDAQDVQAWLDSEVTAMRMAIDARLDRTEESVLTGVWVDIPPGKWWTYEEKYSTLPMPYTTWHHHRKHVDGREDMCLFAWTAMSEVKRREVSMPLRKAGALVVLRFRKELVAPGEGQAVCLKQKDDDFVSWLHETTKEACKRAGLVDEAVAVSEEYDELCRRGGIMRRRITF